MVTTDVGVLDKVMAILGAFDSRTRSLDPATAASRTGMSTPTAYRLMKAMSAHGLLTTRGRSYELGHTLLRLGQLAHGGSDVVAAARPHMVSLRDTVDESVELQVLEGCSRVPVALEPSRRTVRTEAQIGVPLALHRGASARPLVAWMPEDQALELARRSAEAAGDQLDEQAYTERLARIRRRGFDVGSGERDPETGAASAPIFGPSGDVVAMIVASGTTTRFQDESHREAAAEGVLSAARAITADLGGTFPL